MLSQKPVNRELLNFNHRIPVIRSSIGPVNKFLSSPFSLLAKQSSVVDTGTLEKEASVCACV